MYPATKHDETREAVEELVRHGHVAIYAVRSGTEERLSLDEAIGALRDDVNWTLHDGREVFYEVDLTESGHSAYAAVRDRLASSGE